MTTTYVSYNGWTNRETWAVALWLGNTEYLQQEATLKAAEEHEFEFQRHDEFARWFSDDVLEPGFLDEEIREAMRSDVGSLWRVDWPEVVASFIAED